MIGIHIKAKKLQELKDSFKYAKSIGCSHIQIFNENIEDGKSIKAILKKLDLKMVIHSPYVINLAAKFDPHSWRTKYLLLEVENSINNGAIGLVIHMGKSMDLPISAAYNNMYKMLELVCRKIKKPFEIYLETTAGQGTELCYKIEDLGIFFNKIKANPKMKNIKICLDTCHLFCAGYDIRKKKNIDEFICKFDKLVGIDRIGLMHINDSVNDFDTRKDRHANIGEGYIGVTGLRYFYQYFAKRNIPGILETPIGNYENEIRLLKEQFDSK
jgi:deoxyribonuclease-4